MDDTSKTPQVVTCLNCGIAFETVDFINADGAIQCPSCDSTGDMQALDVNDIVADDDPADDPLKQAFEENPVTVRVNFGTEGVTYGVEQVVFDPDMTSQQMRKLRSLGILPSPGLEPYVTVEVVRNTKGYNWTAKVGNAPNVDTAMRMLWDAETKLRLIYSEDGPALNPGKYPETGGNGDPSPAA